MTRQQANYQLVNLLHMLVERNPDARLGQLLTSYGYVKHTRPVSQSSADEWGVKWEDEYYLEPEELLERVETAVANLLGNSK